MNKQQRPIKSLCISITSIKRLWIYLYELTLEFNFRGKFKVTISKPQPLPPSSGIFFRTSLSLVCTSLRIAFRISLPFNFSTSFSLQIPSACQYSFHFPELSGISPCISAPWQKSTWLFPPGYTPSRSRSTNSCGRRFL